MKSNQPSQPNRLISETSPYLLQHAYNPVDWYPWGKEAFALARAKDKPVLLSVGYSSCHWCHVMAHESFEDKETADMMNRDFVNIKVDREERPDIDAIYMSAVQAMTGAGGWPMTVVMTPEGKPFFSGTYFPPKDGYGRPSFKSILLGLTQAWQERREEVYESAEKVTGYLSNLESIGSSAELDPQIVNQALENLAKTFDAKHGGFGREPKFPPHSVLKLLLRQEDKNLVQMALFTLNKMARGGIYDQLGGGFSRYSVDEAWLVPHFEKMLFDNAQLVKLYTEAYLMTKKPLYKNIVEETLEWVKREMLSEEGGFYSALDADSEGVEGKFYVWSEQEIEELLTEDAKLAKAYFDISSMGNFEGHNILNLKHTNNMIAEHFGLSLEELRQKVTEIKKVLFTARAKRIRPGLDDKILCSWNSLMLTGFAEAGRILARQDYIDIAVKNAELIHKKMFADGRLKHSYKDGVAKVEGMLEDYAYYGLALISLYQATFDSKWLLLAFEMAKAITKHFTDSKRGGFFSTPDDGEKLLVRPKDYFDSSQPSDNGAATELLLILSRYTGNSSWESLAAESLKAMSEAMKEQPHGFGTLLCVLDQLFKSSQEIALVGENTEGLIKELNKHFLPYAVKALSTGTEDDLAKQIPFLQQRDKLEGKATAYVCENNTCQLPVTSVEGLKEQLGDLTKA